MFSPITDWIERAKADLQWGGMTVKERSKIRRKWLEEFRRAS